MLESKLQKLFLYGIPLLLLCGNVLAAEPDASTPAPETIKADTAENPENTMIEKTAGDKIASRFVISSGLGLIRAYKKYNKESLRANGLADVKLSYLSTTNLYGKKFYATLRYFPFNIGPSSDENGVNLEYVGVVSTYAAGAEINFSSSRAIDLLASLELAMYFANMKDLIPVVESNPPIRRAGPLAIAGAEVRFKPMEKFHVGPRLYLGTGAISFISFLVNASFYF
jgi:hypothetical protein